LKSKEDQIKDVKEWRDKKISEINDKEAPKIAAISNGLE